MTHDTIQGECFFVITAEASFAVKHTYTRKNLMMLGHQASNLYQLAPTCTNLYTLKLRFSSDLILKAPERLRA